VEAVPEDDMRNQAGLARWQLVAIGFIAAILAWFALDLFSGAEGKIKKQIKHAVAAVEAEDVLELMSVFSPEYQDETGIDYQIMFGLAQRSFKKYADIDVDVSAIQIDVQGDKAEVTMTIWGEATHAASMGQSSPAVREAFEQTGTQMVFSKYGSDWKIVATARMPVEMAIKR
jgi:transcription antitermination factor NusG